MTEIGGYFGLEQLVDNAYYKDLIALNTARNALLYVLKARRIKKLYIPYFLCDSVSGLCGREGYPYSYYRVGRDFLPVLDAELGDGEYIYIVNYYGQIGNEVTLKLKTKYRHVIFDNVQAFYQEPVAGADTIYSCRKFFGVPDGAYLATDCTLDEELPTDVSMDRMTHILGRFEGKTASDYYADFKRNDASFTQLELRKMSKLTRNILGAIDYDRVKRIREENFNTLHEALKGKNPLTLTTPVGPYAYPFYCDNGMALKSRLAEVGIYVPTLWPNVLDSPDDVARDCAENILPLPCDQRYNKNAMQYLIRQIASILKEGKE